MINSKKIFKITAVFYLGFAREKVKNHFLASNVSADKITLRRRKQVAHLRIKWACPERKSDSESRGIFPAAPFSKNTNIQWVDISTDAVKP